MRGAEGPSPLCSGPRRRAKRREERGRVGRPSPSFPPTDALGQTSSLTHRSLSLSPPPPPTLGPPMTNREQVKKKKAPPVAPRFEIKKWNAVAMWSWDICADTVSII